jgi:hypothetical protein
MEWRVRKPGRRGGLGGGVVGKGKFGVEEGIL